MVDPRSCCDPGFTSGSDDAVPAEGAEERRARNSLSRRTVTTEKRKRGNLHNNCNAFVLRSVAGLFTKACIVLNVSLCL